ncbi:prenylcysteine oxidase [Phakopsora pachyrhizi]|uniref:Prenylcysteine oxidase n=1 Tax=Phakopsora pachyrhizi TaxID=170000 RepID=A0A0S1MKE6_PHAPC|nr:prenylcysteine oxidase [Phakopsora pachyrhizi]CAH7671177.1 prenylcysteine oxidase [Phakopsora pachyrhizi]
MFTKNRFLSDNNLSILYRLSIVVLLSLIISVNVILGVFGDLDHDHHLNQIPLSFPILTSSFLNDSTPSVTEHDSSPLRVAIIGGGPGGTSISYFLSKLANISGNQLETHLFDKADYLGGRAKVIYPFEEPDRYPPIEAGASIFVKANRHLFKAVDQFNLTIDSFDDPSLKELAIWDGTEFAFRETGRSWVDKIKLMWRYGKAPLQLDSITTKTTTRFESIYSSEFNSKGPFDNLDDWAIATGLSDLLTVTASYNLVEQEGINVQAVNELVASATRCNYGQDVSTIHALGALVSLAGSEGYSIKGGNRQIYENFATRSGAKLHLSRQVTSISRVKGSQERGETPISKFVLGSRRTNNRSVGSHEQELDNDLPFDVVVLAAPFHQTRFDRLDVGRLNSIPDQPFVHLHVTLLVTNLTSPSAKLFGGAENERAPRSIYSTMMRNVLGAGKRPIFNSLNYIRNIGKREGVIGDMNVVKIFSEGEMSDETLGELFKSSENILWLKRIEWDSYPILNPLKSKSSFTPTKLADSFYYLNGFESLISTMETQTVSAWNVANLITRDRWNFKANQTWFEMV